MRNTLHAIHSECVSRRVTYAKAGLFILFSCFPFLVWGADQDLSGMATTIKKQMTAVATILNYASYVAGVGFALTGILQFKAHKDAPQQTPLSKGVVMLIVAACLLFLPSIMDVAGKSLFGDSAKSASTDSNS